ncbi:Ig-like domain-containing protein [Nitratifractor sp.]|uniref:Ig-like domain-containing protein n=1 Tax=Nitratifractor sp. TaxID=2268144 RepID=UPI0025E687DF|nr:Ig-like domain-containing protein [Nitratifractor sp.]
MKRLETKRLIAYLFFPWLYLHREGRERRTTQRYRRTLPIINVNLLIGLIVFSTLSFGGWGSSNNPTIKISPTSISVDEGNSGTSTVSLTITSSDCPDTSDIKIHWETADGTATVSDNDYASASGDVTFSVPGWFDSCDDADKTKSISVTVNGDTKLEPDETFKVIISDGGTNSSQDFTIGDSTSTITIQNDDSNPPTANDDSASTDEDTAVTIDVLSNDSDPDGDPLSVTSTSHGPSNGKVTINSDNTITYTPNANWHGTDHFDYTISDGTGGTATATVTVTVNPVNDAPIAKDDSANTDVNTSVTIDVLANDTDPDGDTLTIKNVGTPSHGTATISSGKVVYTPDADYNGTDSFAYTVSDGNGGTDTATVTVTVKANQAPVANDVAVTTSKDTNVTVHLDATDPDGDAITSYPIQSGPSHGTLSGAEPDITYTPDTGYSGTDTFTYKACDEHGACSNEATVTITVAAGPVHVDHPSICMESLSYGKKGGLASACFNADGIFTGGTGCIQKLKLRNLSDSPITQSDIDVDYSGFTGVLDNTCGIDGTDETGADCNVSTSPKEAVFNPIGSFDIYKAHTVYLGVVTAAGSSSPFDGTITVNYEQNGTQYTGTLEKCQVAAEAADDLCYDPPVEFDGFMCFQMGEFFGGGIGCTTTIHFRNQGDDTLYNPIVNVITNSMFNGHMIDDCGVDGTSGNCSDSDVLSGPFMGMSGLGMPRTLTYDPLPDFDSNETHSTYSSSLMSANLFSHTTLLGTYVKDGKLYRGEIHACGGKTHYLYGPFNAWDTFRDDASNPPADKNISTKLSGKNFYISVASLNKAGDIYETKPNAESIVVAIYNYDQDDSTSSELISDQNRTFDATSSSHVTDFGPFSVSKAHQHARVGFVFCASYSYDETNEDYLFVVHPASDCSDTTLHSCEFSSTTPVMRICFSQDDFAIRPKEFQFSAGSAGVLDLLRSGKDYNLTVKAVDEGGNPVLDYDRNKSDLALSQTLMLKDGTAADSTHPMNGTLGWAAHNFNISNGMSTEVGIIFNDVGKVDMNLTDQHWADVDADDTPQSCEGGVVGSANVPFGAWICGDENLTFIPDHFKVENIHLHNHMDGNFTYLSSDLNMSAHLDVNISARNAADVITRNFRTGNLYYENPVEVNLSVPQPIIDGYTLKSNEHNITTALLGFGGSDEANGTHAIAWNDTNASQHLMFNYLRTYNRPVNPFDLNGSDVNVTVRSVYTSNIDASKTAEVNGTGSGDRNATFFYARAKPSKYFYDDVVSATKTPIAIEVYNDPFTSTHDLNLSIFRPTGAFDWYLSTQHSIANGDGNVTLTGDANGSVAPASINPVEGVDSTVTVTNTGTPPDIAEINIVGSNTSSWLIYNKDKNSVPQPFYRVRFIGTSGWAGYGQTGHVVESNASRKKLRRLEW